MKDAIDSALVPREVARSRSVLEEEIDDRSVVAVSRSVLIVPRFVALVAVALFASVSSVSSWSSRVDTWSRWLLSVSSEERIDEEALEKLSRAVESVGSWPETPARAFDTAVDTEEAAVDAEVSAVETDVEDPDRSVLTVVKSAMAVDSEEFWFVRSVSTVPATGRFPTPAACTSDKTVPTDVLIELPSTRSPSSLPVAACTAPSRLPASADNPASAFVVFVESPSRTEPIEPEKVAREVRESVTS